MEIKNHISLLFLALILLMPACSKKKQEKQCPVALGDSVQQLALDSDSKIPVINEEVEDFFDEGNISEFAFVDDDFSENKKDLKELFDSENKETVASLDDKGIVTSDFEEEDVTWKEEDELAENEVTFKTVYFDLNQNKVKNDQENSIKENIQKAKAAVESGKKVIIQGHCCQLGSPAYNMPLSERRANAIKKEMVKNGIPEEKIKTVGCGQEVPVAWSDNPNKDEKIKELAANRRSEILVG